MRRGSHQRPEERSVSILLRPHCLISSAKAFSESWLIVRPSPRASDASASSRAATSSRRPRSRSSQSASASWTTSSSRLNRPLSIARVTRRAGPASARRSWDHGRCSGWRCQRITAGAMRTLRRVVCRCGLGSCGSVRTRQGFVRFAHRCAALTRPPPSRVFALTPVKVANVLTLALPCPMRSHIWSTSSAPNGNPYAWLAPAPRTKAVGFLIIRQRCERS